MAPVEHAGEGVGAGQVVGLAVRLLEGLGLATGRTDGGLQHALERHLAGHVGGDAVDDDTAVGAGRPGPERHPAGRPVEADDAHGVLGRLAVREPHQVPLVGRAVVGVHGPRPRRHEVGAGGQRPAQDPLAAGAGERRPDAAVGADGVRVQLVADRLEQRIDRLGAASRRGDHGRAEVAHHDHAVGRPVTERERCHGHHERQPHAVGSAADDVVRDLGRELGHARQERLQRPSGQLVERQAEQHGERAVAALDRAVGRDRAERGAGRGSGRRLALVRPPLVHGGCIGVRRAKVEGARSGAGRQAGSGTAIARAALERHDPVDAGRAQQRNRGADAAGLLRPVRVGAEADGRRVARAGVDEQLHEVGAALQVGAVHLERDVGARRGLGQVVEAGRDERRRVGLRLREAHRVRDHVVGAGRGGRDQPLEVVAPGGGGVRQPASPSTAVSSAITWTEPITTSHSVA